MMYECDFLVCLPVCLCVGIFCVMIECYILIRIGGYAEKDIVCVLVSNIVLKEKSVTYHSFISMYM
jgi:hypothetical protein